MHIDRITYTIQPSFKPGFRVELETRRSEGPFTATIYREILFDEQELQRAKHRNDSKPIAVLEIAPADVQHLHDTCAALAQPAIPESFAGVDGTSYSLTFKCGFNYSTFKRWYELPSEWQSLAPVEAIMSNWIALAQS